MSVSKYCSRSCGVDGRNAVVPLGGTLPPGRHTRPFQKYQPITRSLSVRNQIVASSVPGAAGSSDETVKTRGSESEMSAGIYRASVSLKTYHFVPSFSHGP